jgi:hypothetical protein
MLHPATHEKHAPRAMRILVGASRTVSNASRIIAKFAITQSLSL